MHVCTAESGRQHNSLFEKRLKNKNKCESQATNNLLFVQMLIFTVRLSQTHSGIWLDLQSRKKRYFSYITCFLVWSFVCTWMGTWEEHWRQSSLSNLHGLGISEMKKMYLSLKMQIICSSSLAKQNPGSVWQSLSLKKLALFNRVFSCHCRWKIV